MCPIKYVAFLGLSVLGLVNHIIKALTNQTLIKLFATTFTDEAMNFLVSRILELSSKEIDSPSDVVDLGHGAAEHTSPKYEVSELVGGNYPHNGYTKTAKLSGLPGQIPESSDRNKFACCS